MRWLPALLLTLVASVVRADGAPLPPAETSVVHVRCLKKCTIYLDSRRQTPPDRRAFTFERVAPGAHQVFARDVFNSVIGTGPVEVPAASEVFVSVERDRVRVTATRPLRPAK